MEPTGQLPTWVTFTARSSLSSFGIGGFGGPASGLAIGLASATATLPINSAIPVVVILILSC